MFVVVLLGSSLTYLYPSHVTLTFAILSHHEPINALRGLLLPATLSTHSALCTCPSPSPRPQSQAASPDRIFPSPCQYLRAVPVPACPCARRSRMWSPMCVRSLARPSFVCRTRCASSRLNSIAPSAAGATGILSLLSSLLLLLPFERAGMRRSAAERLAGFGLEAPAAAGRGGSGTGGVGGGGWARLPLSHTQLRPANSDPLWSRFRSRRSLDLLRFRRLRRSAPMPPPAPAPAPTALGSARASSAGSESESESSEITHTTVSGFGTRTSSTSGSDCTTSGLSASLDLDLLRSRRADLCQSLGSAWRRSLDPNLRSRRRSLDLDLLRSRRPRRSLDFDLRRSLDLDLLRSRRPRRSVDIDLRGALYRYSTWTSLDAQEKATLPLAMISATCVMH